MIASLEDVARNAKLDVPSLLGKTRFLGHGTTVGTNALVTRRGARIGLLITAGFEDTPFIQRAIGRIAGFRMKKCASRSRCGSQFRWWSAIASSASSSAST